MGFRGRGCGRFIKVVNRYVEYMALRPGYLLNPKDDSFFNAFLLPTNRPYQSLYFLACYVGNVIYIEKYFEIFKGQTFPWKKESGWINPEVIKKLLEKGHKIADLINYGVKRDFLPDVAS